MIMLASASTPITRYKSNAHNRLPFICSWKTLRLWWQCFSVVCYCDVTASQHDTDNLAPTMLRRPKLGPFQLGHSLQWDTVCALNAGSLLLVADYGQAVRSPQTLSTPAYISDGRRNCRDGYTCCKQPNQRLWSLFSPAPTEFSHADVLSIDIPLG